MGMITIVCIEGSGLETSVITIVECKLDYSKPGDPVVLMIGDDCAKGLLDFLIGLFQLAIGLGVVGSGQGKSDF